MSINFCVFLWNIRARSFLRNRYWAGSGIVKATMWTEILLRYTYAGFVQKSRMTLENRTGYWLCAGWGISGTQTGENRNICYPFSLFFCWNKVYESPFCHALTEPALYRRDQGEKDPGDGGRKYRGCDYGMDSAADEIGTESQYQYEKWDVSR